MLINLALLAVLVVVAVAAARGGLLQGMALFFNVLVAGSFATAWYEVLAKFLTQYFEPYAAFLDVVSAWLLFAVILAVLATVTSLILKVKLPFAPPVDLAGRVLIGLMTGWTAAEFMALSIHTAPLQSDIVPMPPSRSMLFGLKPDRCWLWWVRGSSRNGPFAVREARFDETNDFLERYQDRRNQLSQQPAAVPPGQ